MDLPIIYELKFDVEIKSQDELSLGAPVRKRRKKHTHVPGVQSKYLITRDGRLYGSETQRQQADKTSVEKFETIPRINFTSSLSAPLRFQPHFRIELLSQASSSGSNSIYPVPLYLVRCKSSETVKNRGQLVRKKISTTGSVNLEDHDEGSKPNQNRHSQTRSGPATGSQSMLSIPSCNNHLFRQESFTITYENTLACNMIGSMSGDSLNSINDDNGSGSAYAEQEHRREIHGNSSNLLPRRTLAEIYLAPGVQYEEENKLEEIFIVKPNTNSLNNNFEPSEDNLPCEAEKSNALENEDEFECLYMNPQFEYASTPSEQQMLYFVNDFDLNANYEPFKYTADYNTKDILEESYVTEWTEEDEAAEAERLASANLGNKDMDDEELEDESLICSFETKYGIYTITEEDRVEHARAKKSDDAVNSSAEVIRPTKSSEIRDILLEDQMVSNLVAVTNLMKENHEELLGSSGAGKMNVDENSNKKNNCYRNINNRSFRVAASSSKFRRFLDALNQKWKTFTTNLSTLRRISSERIIGLKKALLERKSKRRNRNQYEEPKLEDMNTSTTRFKSRKSYQRAQIQLFDKVEIPKGKRKRTSIVRHVLIRKMESSGPTPWRFARKRYARRIVPLENFLLPTCNENGKKRFLDERVILIRSS